MHRDHKLALSLGLLLIGVAAALCFPRDQQTDFASLQLEDAAELDAAIDLLPVRVYTESHTDPAADDDQQSETLARALADPFADLALLPGAPDPIPTVEIRSTTGDRSTDVAPAPSSQSTQTETDPPDIVESHTPRNEHNEPQVYEVRSGDTLSELAGRFLGSTRRFLELYEANRDVLASPDDLQVGMLLRIPHQNAGGDNSNVRVASTPFTTEDGSPAPDTDSSDGQLESGRPSFRPAVRSPFAPPSDGTGLRD